jgi:hypothetical protein
MPALAGCDNLQIPTRKSKAIKQSGVVVSGHRCCGKAPVDYRITIRRSDGTTLGTIISRKERKRCPNGAEWPICLRS